MTDRPRELANLQLWMQTVITYPEGIESGLDSTAAREQIDVSEAQLESVVCRSQAQTSVERLAVYGNAYFARLLECMREIFPALAHALGTELFDQFALEYLRRYPSESYTLDRLADRFPRFLRESKPTADDSVLSWPDFLVDLAELELAIGKVFDGPGAESLSLLSAERIAEIPANRWSEVRLVPTPCLRLLAFSWPVSDYYTAFRRDDNPSIPAPSETYLALTRRNYVVHRLSMSREQYALLAELIRGQTIGAALDICAETCDDVDALAANLGEWFRQWSAEQLFQDIELQDE